jgi:hypothetical protein
MMVHAQWCAIVSREKVEAWIDSGARVFIVHSVPSGRVVATGKIIRLDAAGIVFSTAHDRDGRGTFVRLEHFITLRAAAMSGKSPAREASPDSEVSPGGICSRCGGRYTDAVCLPGTNSHYYPASFLPVADHA